MHLTRSGESMLSRPRPSARCSPGRSGLGIRPRGARGTHWASSRAGPKSRVPHTQPILSLNGSHCEARGPAHQAHHPDGMMPGLLRRAVSGRDCNRSLSSRRQMVVVSLECRAKRPRGRRSDTRRLCWSRGGGHGRAGLRPIGACSCAYENALTARATIRPKSASAMVDCTTIRYLARCVSGITSVGLNAVALVNPR